MNPLPDFSADSNGSFARRSELMISIALLAVIVVLLVPLPSVILDMLLALNLAMSVLLLLVTLNAKQPLEVSVFPSLLLLLTLYRLSLNVATTRLILLNGDAGKIVSTFGGFIVGGSLVVGIVIFLILVIIQFIVITKGASRISEVNARFVLDALPGKQMAIDAELNAGTIDDQEAKHKRRWLTREAEFYGAMDGAGKYVRGDAIAGLVITIVNILGGVVFGMTNGRSLLEAVKHYSTLTIGDGLVSQIPALIIATTAGILVTKASTGTSLGHELGLQMLHRRRPLIVGAVIMAVMSLTPGLPKIPFLALAVALFAYSRVVPERSEQDEPPPEPTTPPREEASPEEVGLEEFVSTDRVCLEIGASIIPAVNTTNTKSLPERISTLRREMTRKFGLWVPTVRLRDNLQLDANAYRVLINGREVGKGEIRLGHFMAINPGSATLTLQGDETVEPAFGLAAQWIGASSKQRAEMGGYTVVDAVTVLITHLGEIVRRHAHELLSREDLQKMIDKVKQRSPTVVDELKPDVVRPATLRRVLINLLRESVPISALEIILESAAHHGTQVKDPDELTDRIREDIGHIVCQRFLNAEGQVQVLVMEPALENHLRQSMNDGRIILQPAALEQLLAALRRMWEPITLQDQSAALLIDRGLRRPLRQLVERSMADLAVVSYAEIPSDLMIHPVGIVKAGDVLATTGPDNEIEAKQTQHDDMLARVA